MTEIRRALETFARTVPNGAKVLDVGCGLRPYEKLFSHAEYIGIDVPDSGREASGKKPDFEFDGINIPMNASEADVVICTEVLEHAVAAEELLREMNRVLKPGGALFVTVPFMWGLHEIPYDFRRYTYIGISRAVTNAGFEVSKCEKLSSGIEAIRMLISSETSYFLNHGVAAQEKQKLGFRFKMWLQDWLVRLLVGLWRRTLKFERIYIDNLIIAKKINS